mgnify:CR=1 FL=1
MNKVFKRLLGLSCLALGFSLSAQDAHFTQYFSSPVYTNPALTGQINGNYRVGGNYRTQWNAFGDAYTSAAVSADMRKDAWGLGVAVVQQVTGVANYSNTNFLLSGAYDLAYKTKSSKHLVFGLQLGFINRHTSGKDYTLPDQWEPGFGPVNPLNEDLGKLNAFVPDANFGILWFNGSSKVKWAPFVGATVFHLIPSDDSFDSFSKLPMRFMVHGGARYRTGSAIDITPHAKFSYQDGAYNGIIGANVSYALIDTEVRLEGGVAYRFDDALLPYIGARYMDFQFGVSFDGSISEISEIGRSKNAVEFSLIYTNQKSSVKEKFICPRL